MNNELLLQHAIKGGSTEAVKRCISEGIPLENKDASGRTPVWYAAECGKVDVLEILLSSLTDNQKSSQVDGCDNTGLSPLMAAVKKGHLRGVEHLLPLSKDPFQKNEAGFNCLHIACCHSSKEMIQLLLRHGFSMDELTEHGHSPLRLATIRRSQAIVAFVLEHTKNPDVPDLKGVTPLHEACYWGNEEAIRLMLRAGADPYILTCTGQDAFKICADDNLREKVEEMAKSVKALPKIATARTTPPTSAAEEEGPSTYPRDENPRGGNPLAYRHEEDAPSSSSLSETSKQPAKTAQSDDRWIRHEFLCPITQEVMEDPVICMDGFTYERSSISAWFSQHNTSPTTNAVLESKTLIPNHSLKALISSEKAAARIA